MSDVSEKARENIMQFQQIQQQLQMMLMQKQNLQLQVAEIENALIEVEKTNQDKIYEIIGNVMVKKAKEELLKSLKDKKEMIDLRSSTIEKQIQKMSEKATNLQKELSKEIKD
jgi:prefoldin beta subunit